MSQAADHRDIARIIKGCGRGRRKSQRELYDLLFGSVIREISGFRLEHHEAEDLAQEVFIKVFNNLDVYDPAKANIYTWTKVITKRLAINYAYSQRDKHLRQSIDEAGSHIVADTQDELSLDLAAVEMAIDRMPRQYGDVIRLSIFQGMRHAAIASELDITESSSRVYLTRAINMLKSDMKNYV